MFKNSLYLLDASPVSDILCDNTFSQLVLLVGFLPLVFLGFLLLLFAFCFLPFFFFFLPLHFLTTVFQKVEVLVSIKFNLSTFYFMVCAFSAILV